MKSLYLLLHVFTISFPLMRSFESRIKYASKWKALFPSIAIVAAFFITWDVIFTEKGVWGFNERYLTEVFIFNLPVEEWLFFITVPFASVFIYECVLYFFPKLKTSESLKMGGIATSFFLITLAILNTEQLYTFWNFLFGGLFLLFVSIKNPDWFGAFIVAYFFHLIPFFLVNGVLTGSFIEEEVVWYNNQENFSIRLFTIPVEDTIYSMLLLLMNIYFYELFKKRMQIPT